MSQPSAAGRMAPQPLTFSVWLILIMAAIGFAFDIYELLMLPLVLPPALSELLPNALPGTPDFNYWRAVMFWVPAMAGGLFGLYGGYLTDRLGRRRVLTWSILLYAFSAFFAGYSTSMTMLLVLRCGCFIGVCVEFVAAVAWLAELFPNSEQRERALGYTQAFSSIGGLMVGGAFLLANKLAPDMPAIQMPGFLTGLFGEVQNPHAAWRYTLMSGLIPALPLIIIRPFLPESPVWRQRKEAGTLRRPSFTELFRRPFTRTTIVTTIMVALSYGAAFGAIQQVPQIVPGLPEVEAQVEAALADPANQRKVEGALPGARKFFEKEIADAVRAKASALGMAETEIAALIQQELTARKQEIEKKARGRAETAVVKRPIYNDVSGRLQVTQEVGGLVGRFVLALLVVSIASRRTLIRVFQVPGLLIVPAVFAFAGVDNKVLFHAFGADWTLLHVGIFVVALLTVAQFSFWGNYLPTVYPVHLRGTGESVAANIGGRMIGTSFAALASILSTYAPGDDDPTRMAYTAAAIGLGVYLLGFLASFFLPQPKEEMMHE